MLTGWVQHKIRRKTKNAYKHCYQKNLQEASWEAYELLDDNIKIGDNMSRVGIYGAQERSDCTQGLTTSI